MRYKLTRIKSSVQATNHLTLRVFASILIALSGLMLYTDKVFTFQLANNHGYPDTQTFIWVLTQSLSPVILIVVGALFKPFRIAYTIPLYLYAIQTYWVFDSSLKLDDALLHLYASGTVVTFICSAISINYLIAKFKTTTQQKISFLEQALDLSLTINTVKKND